MDTAELFHSPGKGMAAFSEMQLHLYRQDPSLQDYFEALQLDALTGPRVSARDLRPSGRLAAWTVNGVQKISGFRSRRKIKTDVLFCPDPNFSRKTETRFFVRALFGLVQTGARILCLLPPAAPRPNELGSELSAATRSGQLEFIDPASSLSPTEGRLHWRAARMRARAAFEETVEILEPHGLNPGRDVEGGFERIAYLVEAWERLAPSVEFDAVVARCHWQALCSPVCRTGLQRGKPVVTFQQGVIAHTLDVPVTASKYVAFGQSSASFLAAMNRKFFQSAELPEPSVEFINGGCLFDTVTEFPNQFDQRTLLLVDVPNAQAGFYGIESQCRALLELAERLLTADLPLRIIIRPHPYWSNLDFECCQRLAREHPARCELSHPVWSLDDDLRRSSAVVGIFSGVLTVAAACGLPAIFLATEHGYSTGDLACFSGQTLLPDQAFCEIGRIVTDSEAYAGARTQALRNAREYYANGTNLDLRAEFFERLLKKDPQSGYKGNDLK